ncbi:GIY-YIG nuclease family protein [Oscillibacter sp. MSJ-2]|uniref:GIY-YIG nuclease family protein n=1 Tax=Dysosmobacter acutus TaxID=2841504 RepID=A0ABS6FCE3_9FIRM|nr:GIY-YIG nuclease family protein [Dysosmobacter acutus]MBU5627944.1 GIY-YIG nuclease family protein [Dysosmobacter acutus]
MDAKRKKELLDAYKNRCPDMGVISLRCTATGESFLGISKDIPSGFNSVCFKLSSGGYPNRRLQSLWSQYGEAGFERLVMRTLEYDDPRKDHMPELKKLLDQCLAEDPQASLLWK